MICAKCYKESPKDSIYCQNCGEKFQLPAQEINVIADGLNNHQESEQSDSDKETRYCKHCGGKISLTDRICESCGKRNSRLSGFRLSANNIRLLVLITLVLGLAGLNVFQYMDNVTRVELLNAQLQDKEKSINTLRGAIDSRNQEISSLQIDNYKQRTTIEFFNRYVVFVIEGYGKYYYTYDEMMNKVGNSEYSFWAYNIDAAIGEGYRDGK